MILLLLKNRGLRVQLFVGLLLVLGTVPEGSEGVKCYTCEKEKDANCITIQDCPEGYLCMNGTFGGTGYTFRGCFPADYYSCIKNQGYSVPCGPIPADVFVARFDAAVACAKGEGQFQIGSFPGAIVSHCICNADLCNIDQSKGVKCYSCNEAAPDCKQIKECSAGEGFCGHEESIKSSGKVTEKGCLKTSNAKCVQQLYGHCVTAKNSEEVDEFQAKMLQCNPMSAEQKGRQEERPKSFKTCICDTDLCNNATTVGLSESNIIRPFNGNSVSIIIFAILTVHPFYNYV